VPESSLDNARLPAGQSIEERALAGDANAQHQLGVKFYNGIGTAQDFTEAARWFAMAAAQGHSGAQANLGLQYQQGTGVEFDIDKARALYQTAAANGQGLAAHNLGYLAETSGNLEEAARWYEKGAELGQANSISSLAFAYSNGRGVAQDIEKAFILYNQAADLGDGMAVVNLGMAYLYGHKTGTDHRKGFDYLMRAADLGKIDAFYHLAIACDNGWGTAKNPESAQTWMTLASLSGNQQAQQDIREHPDLIGTDISGLLAQAHDGKIDAIRTVAKRLYDGDGCEKDMVAAKAWLQEAALRGDAWSQTTFGLILRSTKIHQNEIEAHRWLSKAAEQRDARAIFNKGLDEIVGSGTPVDLVQGAQNILTASLWGFPDARGAYEMLLPDLSNDLRTRVYSTVKWPIISLILGIKTPRENKEDYTSEDEKSFETIRTFVREALEISSYDGQIQEMFRDALSSGRVMIGPTFHDGDIYPTISFSVNDLMMPDGWPIHWKPDDEELKNLGTRIRDNLRADWLRYNYTMV
jgi:TPR repeat protein